MAEETRSGASRRPSIQEVERAEQFVKSTESCLIEDALRAERGDQRVHGPPHAVARAVAESRAKLQRLLVAREVRDILTDSDTARFARGPLSIDCNLARELGWTADEIERAAHELNDRAALNNDRGAIRRGQVMRCVRCEKAREPPEPCTLPSSWLCAECAAALPHGDDDQPAAAPPPQHPGPHDDINGCGARGAAECPRCQDIRHRPEGSPSPVRCSECKVPATKAIYGHFGRLHHLRSCSYYTKRNTPDLEAVPTSAPALGTVKVCTSWSESLLGPAPSCLSPTCPVHGPGLQKLLDRKRAAVIALEIVKTAERDLVAAGLSTIPTGGNFTEGAYAQGVVYGKALQLHRTQAALTNGFREEEIAEARTARAMGLASTLLLQFAKRPDVSSTRRHDAAVLADWLKLGAPEAFDTTKPAIPEELFSSDILVHLAAVCPDGHAKQLLSGPITHWLPFGGPPRHVDLMEDQRVHLYCYSAAANPVGCGKPLRLRLSFEVVKSRWQET